MIKTIFKNLILIILITTTVSLLSYGQSVSERRQREYEAVKNLIHGNK